MRRALARMLRTLAERLSPGSGERFALATTDAVAEWLQRGSVKRDAAATKLPGPAAAASASDVVDQVRGAVGAAVGEMPT